MNTPLPDLPDGPGRVALEAFGDAVMHLAASHDVHLHAVILIATEGGLILEGVSTAKHRDAVAAEIRGAAEHLAAMEMAS